MPIASLTQKYKGRKRLVIEKQPAKGEQTHPVCLHAVDKKVESVNTQND